MKIQKLHINNIASIEDATIDFAAEPLASSDVFLITGDTGAGKTTILDCICLALFNNTPRLAKGKNQKVKNDGDELTLKDPRRMMRRNTGEALVELSFETGGVEYEAEWHVQRGKLKKTTVAIDNVNRAFKNLRTGETITGNGTKDAELQAKIQEVIGLDFDQFCRTTMLAQNEFTKFLASNEEERADILEKITKTTDFSVAGSKIYEITSQKKQQWENAQEKAADTGLKEDEITEKKTEKDSLEADAKKKKEERDNADKKRDWLAQEKQLAEAKAMAEVEYEEVKKVLEGNDYKKNELFVSQWNRTIDIRRRHAEMLQADAEIKAQEELLAQEEVSFVTVLNGFAAAQEELNSLVEEQLTLEKFINESETRISAYDNCQTIITYIDTIATKRKNSQDLAKQIEKGSYLSDQTLRPAMEKAKLTWQEIENSRKKLETEISGNEDAYKELDMPVLRKQNDETKELMHDIKDALGAIEAINTAENAQRKEEQRLKEVEKELTEKKRELTEKIIPAFRIAEADKEVKEASRDLLHKSIETFAKQMRTHLLLGCECPVCRQKVDILPVETEIDSAYHEAESLFQEAKKEYEKAESAKNQTEAKIRAEEELYNCDLVKFKNDRTLENARLNALTTCTKCGVNYSGNETTTLLENLWKEKKHLLDNTIVPRIIEGDEMEKHLGSLRKQLSTLLKDCEKAKNALDEAKKSFEDCNTDILTKKELMKAAVNDQKAAEEAVCPLLGESLWTHDLVTEPELFKKELHDAATEFARKEMRKKDLENIVSHARENLGNIASTISEIRIKQTTWEFLASTKPRKLSNLETRAHEVLNKVGVIAAASVKAKEAKNSNASLIHGFLADNPDLTLDRIVELEAVQSVAHLADMLEMQRRKPSEKKAVLEKSKADYNKHQETKPSLSEDDTFESTDLAYKNTDQAMVALNQKIAIIRNELDADAKKKEGVAALKEAADAALLEYEKWKRLNDLLGDKEGTKFRGIAQSYIFEGLLNSANTYLQKLEPRYMLKAVEGTLISSLEDAYQGFASRDTNSLSGGESFLVSLALALALSDIGQGLAVDTLFIDEGFGSLSGSPLTNAINMLRSLRGKNGRHVGIISHIQEVRENISVQINVRKRGEGRSIVEFSA